MRVIVALLSLLLVAAPAGALTLYNSRDSKTQSASSKAAEQLNRAFSKMFEVLAAVERRSFDEAQSIKVESVKQFQESSKLFLDVAQQASDEKIVPVPRDDEDKQTIRRMMELSKSYGIDSGELSERRLFNQLSRVFGEFANALSEFPPSAFAKELKDQRMASQFLARAIRLQEFGRITTAYLTIPSSR